MSNKITLATSASDVVVAPRRAAPAITAAKHDAVRSAAYVNRGGWLELLKLLGTKPQDELRADVVEGDYMRQLGMDLEADLERARHQLWNCVGHKTKAPPKEGQGRRTAKQETAYGSARQVWSRYLKKCEVKPEGKGAGNNNAANKGQGKTSDEAQDGAIVSAPVQPAAPVAVTAQVAREFCAQQAAMLLAYANKNAKVMPIELRNAIGAFVTATKLPEEAAPAKRNLKETLEAVLMDTH